MLKRLVFMFLLVLGVISSGFSICSFDEEFQNECDRYYSGSGSVYIQVPSTANLDDSSLEIFQNSVSQSYFLTKASTPTSYSLENPLIHSGVYSIKAKGKDELGTNIFTLNDEIIIDVYQPLPPKVPLIIEASTIKGFGDHQGDTIVAYNSKNSELSRTTVNEDSSFSMDLNLLSPAYVSFVAISPNGLISEQVQRYVYVSERPQYKYTEIPKISETSKIAFDKPTMAGVNSVVLGTTYKRNFYVSGSTPNTEDGTLIYVNGQKVQVIQNSFGVFTELNTGSNIIEIKSKSGIIHDTYSVIYDDSKFNFERLEIQKVFDSTFSISGKTSIKKPFLVFVNGKFINEIVPEDDNSFTFMGTNIEDDKIHVELYGENNVYESQILYKDRTSPQVISYNFDKQDSDSLLFKITDDVGIDYSSISLNLNSNKKLYYANRFGEYLVFNIFNLSNGEYEYTLNGNDLFGRELQGDITGNIVISNTLNFNINSNSNPNIKTYGSIIFSKEETISLDINSSDAIAFKHIYVDGIDHVTYEIKSNNIVRIQDLNLKNENGSILFEYVDKNGVTYEKKYLYIVDTKKSEILIDSIVHSARGDSLKPDSYVRISGKVIDPLFDWNSFYINSNIPFFTSNNYFEIYVDVSDKDLSFSGGDIVNNGLLIVKTSSVFDIDSKSPNFLIGESPNAMLGGIQNTFSGYEEFISLENTKFIRSKLEDSFNLSLEQREGLQIMELRGRNQFSQKEYSTYFTHQSDSTDPQLYLIEENNSYYLHIDPTYSKTSEISIVDENQNPILGISCKSIFTKGSCSKVDVGTYTISIIDEVGNSYETSSVSSKNFQEKAVDFNGIYLHGNDIGVTSKDITLQGSFISEKAVDSILINGEENCTFDTSNFICETQVGIGNNEIEIELYYLGETIEEENITIIREGNASLYFDVTIIDGIFDFNSIKYYFGGDVTTFISLSEDAKVSYFINGEETIISESIASGNTTLDISLDDYIVGRDNVIIDLAFQAENDDIKKSSIFTLIYEKSKDLILEILIK